VTSCVRVEQAAELMEEDMKRIESGEPSLIDLNLAAPTTGLDVIMGTIQLCEDAWDPASTLSEEQRTEARKQLRTVTWPYILKRLGDGEYDVKRKDKEGWTALTLLAYCFILQPDAVIYRIAECLLKLGANVNERDPTYGATPLVMQAWMKKVKNAYGLQLLLRYGADVNAQRKDGNTFLHDLAILQNFPALRQLYTESQTEMMAIDYSLKNNNGETALQLAQLMHQQATGGEAIDAANEIVTLLECHSHYQSQRLPPFILSALEPHLIPDLASIIVSYMHASSASPSWSDQDCISQLKPHLNDHDHRSLPHPFASHPFIRHGAVRSLATNIHLTLPPSPYGHCSWAADTHAYDTGL